MRKLIWLAILFALFVSILAGSSKWRSLENQNLLSSLSSSPSLVSSNSSASSTIQTSALLRQSIHFASVAVAGIFSEGVGQIAELDENGNRTKAEGFIDKKGRVAIKPRKNVFFGNFSEGLAYFGIDYKSGDRIYKFGYIDKSGKVVIEPRFDWAKSFSEGLARVSIDNKWGFIDRHGQIVISPKFDRAVSFSEGLAAVSINRKWGFINHKGEMVIEPQFKGVPSQFSIETGALVFSEGKAAVWVNDKIGSAFIDRYGKLAINKYFGYSQKFQNGFAWASDREMIDRDRSRKYYIDTTGKPVASADDEFRSKYTPEDIEPIEIQGKYGYADSTGEVVIPPKFSWAGGFYDGFFAPVAIGKHPDRKYGFISYSGNWITQPSFKSITQFSNDVAIVSCSIGVNMSRRFYITKGDIIRNAPLQPDWCQWLRDEIARSNLSNTKTD
jgi:hypothetical protein